MFAVLMHAHLAGRAITTRHFRDNQELPPLSHDAEFDFNFQEFQLLEEETPVLPVGNLAVFMSVSIYLFLWLFVHLSDCL